jgi:RNA polymerase sigma factor (TIGR02999 family)
VAHALATLTHMNEASRVLEAAERGDPTAPSQLLPLVYDELRQLAAKKLALEKPGQTLEATALVHEAYLRLVDQNRDQPWHGRRYFFAAAAEAMRRILVEKARHKQRTRHGGGKDRVDLDNQALSQMGSEDQFLEVHELVDQLAQEDPMVADVVKVRFFVGLSIQEAAEALGISVRMVNRHWAYARAWLYQRMGQGQ